MLCNALRVCHQVKLVKLQAHPCQRRSVAAAASGRKQTVWNGEGPDYDMRDVERFCDGEAARRFHQPAEEGQWDGEGKDYDMLDVAAFHMRAARGVQTVWNGEGPDFDMRDVERFHEQRAAETRRPCPDPSQCDGEGPDFDMRDVERFHEEAVKDSRVRRK